MYINSLLQFLLSNLEIFFHKTMVYNTNDLYCHEAKISNDFNSSSLSNKGLLACH